MPARRITTADEDEQDDSNERELTRSAESFQDILVYDDDNGSSAWAATFNFTNCIIGAGAIGLGGAIARAGGLISIVTIICFAVLVKKSLDLIIQVTIDCNGGSYEELGAKAFGRIGKYLVMASKFAYSAGCLVAYIVVIQDNLGPALINLLYGTTNPSSSTISYWLYWLLGHNVWLTWVVSTLIVLPLCLLRDMTPLASASVVSVIAMLSIVGIVIYFWWIGVGNNSNDNNSTDPFVQTSSLFMISNSTSSSTSSTSFYQHWLEIRWSGYLNNLGTFVFTFVCQHTAHLTYESLQPAIRKLSTWGKVTAASLSLSCLVSLAVGIFVYMTFWEKTESDIFEIYPSTVLLDLAKLLLCITMLLTFPLPFLTCRELFIVFFFPVVTNQHNIEHVQDNVVGTLQEPLLPTEQQEEEGEIFDCEQPAGGQADNGETQPDRAQELAPALEPTGESTPSVTSVVSTHEAMNSVLLQGEDRQLKLPYHIAFTSMIWFVVTGLAIASPNLGDVLDLVGCVSGTLIAFILPGCFAIRLQGYSHTAGLILVVGGIVGSVGTFFSLKQFVKDTFGS